MWQNGLNNQNNKDFVTSYKIVTLKMVFEAIILFMLTSKHNSHFSNFQFHLITLAFKLLEEKKGNISEYNFKNIYTFL